MQHTPLVPAAVRSFDDLVTGARIHQLTDEPGCAWHCYFTADCWFDGDRRFLVLVRADGRVGLREWTPGGWKAFGPQFALPPAEPGEHPLLRIKRSGIGNGRALWERGADRMVVVEDETIRVVDGQGRALHTLPSRWDGSEALVKKARLTRDGRDLIVQTSEMRPESAARIDPPSRRWFTHRYPALVRVVSSLWRIPLATGRPLRLFHSNGDQTHPLVCPWDPELILWANYLHGCLYTIRRDGSGLERHLGEEEVGHANHFSWDPGIEGLSGILGLHLPDGRPAPDGASHLISYTLRDRGIRRWKCADARHGYHPNASPDGRWIVVDHPGFRIGGKNALHLVDRDSDELVPLCQVDTTWKLPGTGAHTGLGRAGKTEWLHTNPIWSPDGRYIVFSSDRQSGVTQVYLVDLDSIGLWPQS